MVPEATEKMKQEDPLLIVTEEYNRLWVNKNGFIGEIPEIKGVEPCDNLQAHIERKLFMHNAGYALCSYW